RGAGNRLTLEDEILYPDSFGLLYSHVTELLGFIARADEHRLQWLSATGEPRWEDVFDDIASGRAFDRSYFDPGRDGRGGFRAKFFEKLGVEAGAPLLPRDRADLAASVQHALQNYVL